MKTEIPFEIRSSLSTLGVSPKDILISVATDINSFGRYDPQWLIVTNRRMMVFDLEFGDSPLFTFNIDEIQTFRTLAAVGSGLLQIKVEDVWLDLMRFSNRLKHSFDTVLRRLEQLKRGDHPAIPFEGEEADPQRCPNCGLMLEFPGELCTRCIKHGASLSRVFQLLKPYWKSAGILLTLLVFGIALDMALPMLTRYLVDHVLTPGLDGAPPFDFMKGKTPHQLLLLVVGGVASVHLFRGTINVFTGRITGMVSNAMTYDVRARMVKKLQDLGLAYYTKQETGSLVGRTLYDTDAIQGFLSQVTSGFFMQFLLVIISFVMMVGLEPSLALWAITPAPFVFAGSWAYWKFVHPLFQRFWDRQSKQAGLLSGILSGIRVVKAFGQEDYEFKRFQKASMNVRKTREKLDRTAAYFYPIMAIVFQVGGWIIWYVGGQEVLGRQVSLGTLMAFFGYLGLFYGPLGHLTNLTSWLTQFSTQMHRIFELLDTPAVLPVAERHIKPAASRGEIEFKDVTFGYSRGNPILHGLSFHVRPGEKIGIVGRSGSGKTSIINLICRFYDVETGQVLVDRVDIRKLSKQELGSRISIVLQEPFLFHGTLLDNIKYGRPNSSLEDVIEAARAANASDFIMQHPLAYDTSVGERGSELSGGERQRISIARAFLRQAPILILDEATSSVDTESELAIQAAIERISAGKTIVTIAHRLSTLRNCDRIYMIENGNVLEAGSHDELMKFNGRYASWARIQSGGDGDWHNPKSDKERRTPAGRTRWLEPMYDSIERGMRHEMQVKLGEGKKVRGCFALRCFPVHHPESFISIRYVDDENRVKELGIVRKISEWPTQTQNLIRESLDRRYFFHTIRRIHSIKKISQFLEFKAATNLGTLEFTLKYDPESAQDYGKSGKLLIDVEDNLYVISNVADLNRADREMLDRYIYW